MGGAPARLKTRRDFLRVAGTRRKWVTPGFILQIAPQPAAPQEAAGPASARDSDTAGLRVGFTTSRKVGNAVKRNRARRRLRAVADQILPQYAQPGFDYVLIGRADATVSLPFDQMLHDLRWALKRLGALRGHDGNGNKVDAP
ncbi:ribonuclease P protein component [Caenispirillum bisanense]|uniref:ribonuclease P protein component n=1 Tax=Caenispirillum bisanense TaxID=414052 RepID=UPI0031DBCAE8